MIDLIMLPLAAGLLIATVAGPLGCFVVWNRMAYFGDTLAHSALLGVSLAFLVNIHPDLGIFISCLAVACALLFFKSSPALPRDTLLGIFAHGSLAAGIVLASFSKDMRMDLMAFLFGDILAVNYWDLVLIALVCVSILLLLVFYWSRLLNSSMDPELAQVEGLNTRFLQALLLFLLAGLIAFSIKIIGVLLIAALLIIPAASARLNAGSPAIMAMVASVLAMGAVFGGLFLSWFVDSPAGPSIVLFSFVLFVLISLASKLGKLS